MKTMLSFALLGVAYCYPEVTIASLIAVLFVLDVLSKLINADIDKVGRASYSMVKEVLNDPTSEYYLSDVATGAVEADAVVENEKVADVGNKADVVIDYRSMSYRDIQQLCRDAGIKRVNRKKKLLIAALQNV